MSISFVVTSDLSSSCLLKVNVEDTVEMLPKSRRALTIQEIAALARSSLHGKDKKPCVCGGCCFPCNLSADLGFVSLKRRGGCT